MSNAQPLRGFTTISYWAADLEAAKRWKFSAQLKKRNPRESRLVMLFNYDSLSCFLHLAI